jgi:flagellar motor switch protein FliN/FliY
MTEEPEMTDPNELSTDLAGAEVTLADLDAGARHAATHSAVFPGTTDLSLVLDVPVELVVEIGRTRMTIRETLGISRGTIISLDRLAGEPADLLVNGRLVARGEVVAIDEEFGLRVTEVIAPESRVEAATALVVTGAGS